MNDVFKEQIVKRKQTLKEKAIRFAALFICVFAFVVSFVFVQFMAFPIALVLWFAARYLLSFLNVEYEYIFTSGDLDIDKIYDKTRRKRIYTGDVKNIQIMTPVNEMGYEATFKRAEKTFDCTGGEYGDNTYKFMVLYKEKHIQIVFEPDGSMLDAMRPYLGQQRLVRKI